MTREASWCLPSPGNGRSAGVAWSTAGFRRQGVAELAVRGRRRGHRASGRRGSARGAPAGASRGSGGLRSRRRRGICRGDGAHLGRVRVENPERPRSNGTRRAAGDDPGSTKGSCGGRWRLGGRSGAGPRRSRGATGQSGVEAAALGFVGRRLRMGEQGGAARATYRAAAALACVHAVGKPARTAARISAARRGRRGAGVWGHGVSGSGRLRALRS
jgi:hypothetical protein